MWIKSLDVCPKEGNTIDTETLCKRFLLDAERAERNTTCISTWHYPFYLDTYKSDKREAVWDRDCILHVVNKVDEDTVINIADRIFKVRRANNTSMYENLRNTVPFLEMNMYVQKLAKAVNAIKDDYESVEDLYVSIFYSYDKDPGDTDEKCCHLGGLDNVMKIYMEEGIEDLEKRVMNRLHEYMRAWNMDDRELF